MLTLPIKKKWFDMILSGEKEEEYREFTKYYNSRFRYYRHKNFDGTITILPFFVCFRNGYRKDSPSFVARCTVTVGKGKPEWGAEPGETYFILHIEDITDIRLKGEKT